MSQLCFLRVATLALALALLLCASTRRMGACAPFPPTSAPSPTLGGTDAHSVETALASISACPSLQYTDPRRIANPRAFGDTPWSRGRKFLVSVDGAPYVLKTTLANFEIVYGLIAQILRLDHARFEPRWSSLHGRVVVLNPFFRNVVHGWKTAHRCLNLSDRATVHMLYNDFLMGYSDRMPNCHLVGGSAVPIDQDSGAYTAVLPPQTDRQYEKHLLHNRMMARDADARRALWKFVPCNRTRYAALARCLPGALAQFPIHSTRLEHVLFRFNESFAFACPDAR